MADYEWYPVNFVEGGGWMTHSDHPTKADAMRVVAKLKRKPKYGFAIKVSKDKNSLKGHEWIVYVR